jgi:hypothetical protein
VNVYRVFDENFPSILSLIVIIISFQFDPTHVKILESIKSFGCENVDLAVFFWFLVVAVHISQNFYSSWPHRFVHGIVDLLQQLRPSFKKINETGKILLDRTGVGLETFLPTGLFPHFFHEFPEGIHHSALPSHLITDLYAKIEK